MISPGSPCMPTTQNLSVPPTSPVSLSISPSSICLSVLITCHSFQGWPPHFPRGSRSPHIRPVPPCASIPSPASVCPSPGPNQMCGPCRVAIAQHLPCLGVLLGVSRRHSHPYPSYRSTHRSTLISHTSNLSWISGRRRQESLGSESEVVRTLGLRQLAPGHPFLRQPWGSGGNMGPGGATSETQGLSGRWHPDRKRPSQHPHGVHNPP